MESKSIATKFISNSFILINADSKAPVLENVDAVQPAPMVPISDIDMAYGYGLRSFSMSIVDGGSTANFF